MTPEQATKTVTEALLAQADRWCLDEDKAAGIAACVVGALSVEPDLELGRLRDENRTLCDYVRAAAGDESCLLPASTLELMSEDRARVGERLRAVEEAAMAALQLMERAEAIIHGPTHNCDIEQCRIRAPVTCREWIVAEAALGVLLHGEPPIETRLREQSGPPREYVRWAECPRRSDRAEGCRPTARPPDESSPPS